MLRYRFMKLDFEILLVSVTFEYFEQQRSLSLAVFDGNNVVDRRTNCRKRETEVGGVASAFANATPTHGAAITRSEKKSEFTRNSRTCKLLRSFVFIPSRREV